MFWSKKRKRLLSSSARAVSFEFFDEAAIEVFLCADFNSWDVKASPLRRDSSGKWLIIVNLVPGRYEYRFLVDGQWRNDKRPVYLTDNIYGSQNCVIEV